MAKKKHEEPTLPHEEPQTAHQTAPEEKKVSKADAVRAALAEGLDGNEEACNWIQAKYGIEIDAKTYSVYKSKEKAKGSGAEGTGTVRRTRQSLAPSEPTLDDLLAIKDLADKGEGVAAVLGQLDTIKDMSDRAGGLDKLRKCLAAIVKLSG